MELIYLWIHKGTYDCIKNQELNFSPIHRFSVDNKDNPTSLKYEKCENEINFMKSDKISNMTAIVGSNGVGKSSLLSFIANNNCYDKFSEKTKVEYEKYYSSLYENEKSIYIFKNNNNFILYYNLENELIYPEIIKKGKVYHNICENKRIPMLCDMRSQMIIYLSNSYYVPNGLMQYSQSRKTYNINLHLQSLNLISNRFYKLLWGIEEFSKSDIKNDITAKIVCSRRNERTFQELLDVMYYSFLKSNGISDVLGKFKNEIYVYFENIISLGENFYFDDIETISYINSPKYEFDGCPDINLKHKSSEKYYNKQNEFLKKYNIQLLEKIRRINVVSVLYFNLLFEFFLNNDNFILPELNLNKDIYKQLTNIFKMHSQYLEYLKDIKEVDDILSECRNYENIIENPDDLACQYQKIIGIDNNKFYSYFEKIFKERKSYVLKYIRIKNLEMSSGERAMQNMFSWLTLTAQIDDILSIERDDYTSKLLLIDEIDLYSHPDWQRKIIAQLIDTINKIEKVPVQIIITSHSPIILSDFPKQNIIYLSNNGETTISDDRKHKQSFGANIYTLFNDAFFLKEGVIGEYAKKKILDVYNELTGKSDKNQGKFYYKNFIDILGDGIIKKEMQKLFNKKIGG